MRCTAASSKRGGACSAQTLAAVVCGARLVELAELSKALVSAFHLQSSTKARYWCAVLWICHLQSVPQALGLLCYEVAQVFSAVVCVCKVGRGANAGVQNRPLQCNRNLKFCQQRRKASDSESCDDIACCKDAEGLGAVGPKAMSKPASAGSTEQYKRQSMQI